MILPAALLHSLKVCQHSLIQEDPYQWQASSIDTLVDWYWLLKNQGKQSPALINEMKYRITQPTTSEDDREILQKTLANE